MSVTKLGVTLTGELKSYWLEHRGLFYLAILGLAGVFLILFSTSLNGSGMNPDSVHYLSAARSLLNGNGFIDVSGSPYVTWPPLFPALLALLGFGGIDPVVGMRVLNAVFFGFIIFLSGFWLMRYFKSVPVALLGSLAILFSVPLLLDSQFILTETLFILLVLLSIFGIKIFLDSGKKRWLFLSAVFTAFACLTRYAGVAVIITGLILLLFRQKSDMKSKVTSAAIFVVVSFVPLAVWMSRNYIISSTLLGPHSPSDYNIIGSSYAVLDTISQFFLPSQLPIIPRILIILLLFTVAFVIFVTVTRQTRDKKSFIDGKAIIPLIVFSITYVIFLIITSTINHYDIAGYRLESPVYVPLILIAAATLINLTILWGNQPWQKTLNIALIGLVCIWLIYPILGVIHVAQTSLRDGIDGYTTQKWKQSELINYVKEHPLNGQIFSNDPYAIYLYTGLNIKMSPNYYTSAENASKALQQFKETVNAPIPTYIVWFDISSIWRVYNIHEISTAFNMEKTEQTSDGSIYLVTEK
jgi:4-amino-4-deoxy-L-arabinose transferase-like glycosyltransferase